MKNTGSTGQNWQQRIIGCGVAVLLLFQSSCSTLPHYSKPRFQQGVLLASFSTIPYRDLKVSDFKGKELPEVIRAYSHRLSAHTAISIRPVKKARFIVSPLELKDKVVYIGAIEDLAFEAVMVPEKSWWNPKLAKKRYNYVLQHEQIHFALMELAVQKLNRFVNQSETPVVYEETPKEAGTKLWQQVKQLIADSKETILKEHTRFDEETSGYYVPEVQQQWYNKVTGELQ